MDRVLDAIEAFWDYLASVQLLPLALAIALPRREARLHEPCLAQRPRRRLSRTSACAGARSSPRTPRASASTRVFPARAGDVVRLTSPTGRSRARRTRRSSLDAWCSRSSTSLCALALFAWALTQGVLPGPRRPPVAAELRLRVVPPSPARRRDRCSSLLVFGLVVAAVWVRPRCASCGQRVAPGVHRRPHPGALAPHRRRLAARRLGAAARDDLVHARTRSASSSRLRNVLLVQATAEPRDARPRQPRRRRHRAGVPRLHAPRPGVPLRRSSPSASA